uniref:ATP synthase subunit b n=1 Tax=Balaenoptera musculus TaxID=9771 RepID=A0A8C0CMA6_BALMU
MLPRVVLSAATAAAPSLENAALLGPGLLQATRIFHTEQQSLAPVPPLPEYGGKVRFGLMPEEFFQFLYPKTGKHMVQSISVQQEKETIAKCIANLKLLVKKAQA